MQHRTDQRLGDAPLVTGGMHSPTIDGRPPDDAVSALFAGVTDPERLRIEMVARSATDQSAALVQIVELLVGGPEAQRDAIVEAIRSNEALSNQWERAWHALRS